MLRRIVPSVLSLVLLLTVGAVAQDAPASPPQAPFERADPDARIDPLQPDFNLATLPTTLRMPKGKWAFRVTHRFTRELGSGDLGDLVSDFFGIDGGAQIGLELRYGLLPGTQIGIHRTSDRTIQLFAQQSVFKQRDGAALSLDGIATIEGFDNLRGHRLGTFGVVMSRNVGRRAAVYVEPLFVANANPFNVGDNNSVMLGLGARVRVRPSTYLVGEYTPRLAGYDPNADQVSFGVEMRAGGHLFQLNVSNGFGTTLGQLATGGVQNDTWFLDSIWLGSFSDIPLSGTFKGGVVNTGTRLLAAHTIAAVALVAVAACGGGGGGSPTGPGTGGGSPGPSGATITIANGRVTPATVTISVGQSVTFINTDGRTHNVSSDPHPVHTDCPSTNAVNNISNGQTKLTNAFTGARSCGFHDHDDPDNGQLRGTIVIQ